jgi:hypothetical protein
MALAPGRSDARSLVITGKPSAAGGVAVLTSPAPTGGRRPVRLRLARYPDRGQAALPPSHHALSRGYNGRSCVLLKTLDFCKI